MSLRAIPLSFGEAGSFYQAVLTFLPPDADSKTSARATLTFLHAQHAPIELNGTDEATLVQTAQQIHAAAVSLARDSVNRTIRNLSD